MDQIAGLRVANVRKIDEYEKTKKLARELQSIGDEHALIGKLTHSSMIARWREAQTNRKFKLKCEELMKQEKVNEIDRAKIEELNWELESQNTADTEALKEL